MRVQSLKELSDEDWTREKLMQKMRDIIDAGKEGRKASKDVYHYLRNMVTGMEEGMRIYDVLLILGRKETLARLGCYEN